MVSRKDSPGYFDGMERAQPGEPVFTLRGNDALAASLVSLWCERRREAILAAGFSDERRAIELIQVQEAEEIGWAMDDWRKGIVDQATPEPVIIQSYSGNVISKDELAAKEAFDRKKRAAQLLNNALADIDEANELVGIYGLDAQRRQLAIDIIREIASIIQPKRASYSHRASDAN